MSFGPDENSRKNAHANLLKFVENKLSNEEFKQFKILVNNLDSEAYSYGWNWGALETEAGEGL